MRMYGSILHSSEFHTVRRSQGITASGFSGSCWPSPMWSLALRPKTISLRGPSPSNTAGKPSAIAGVQSHQTKAASHAGIVLPTT